MPAFSAFETSFGQHCFKMLAALTGLVGMLFLGLHILKKYRFGRSRRQPLIQVLETHYLAPKATLHLVAVGSTRFLVGNAGERLTLLTALPVPEEDQEEAMTGQMGSLADPAP